MASPASHSKQLTSSIFKFSCLYTHDLIRKQKRWQDGFISFHTFNKRVMVYDTSGNFVGDMHWRESTSICDGDELQLDRGIIVQVGEEVERKEQDISQILDRRTTASRSQPTEQRRGQQGPSPRELQPVLLEAPGMHTRERRPKSIRAVLDLAVSAVSKTQINCASPYQQAQLHMEAGQRLARPSKRVKLSHRAQVTAAAPPAAHSKSMPHESSPAHSPPRWSPCRSKRTFKPPPVLTTDTILINSPSDHSSSGLDDGDAHDQHHDTSLGLCPLPGRPSREVTSKFPSQREREARDMEIASTQKRSYKSVQILTTSKSRRNKLISKNMNAGRSNLAIPERYQDTLGKRRRQAFEPKNQPSFNEHSDCPERSRSSMDFLPSVNQVSEEMLSTITQEDSSKRLLSSGARSIVKDGDEMSTVTLQSASMAHARNLAKRGRMDGLRGQESTIGAERQTSGDADSQGPNRTTVRSSSRVTAQCSSNKSAANERAALKKSLTDPVAKPAQMHLAPLQRSASDSTATKHDAADVGPWSREAFDLFGWHPGEPKGCN